MPETLLPAYLLAGPEEGEKDDRVAALKKLVEEKAGGPPEVHRFHATDPDTRMPDVVEVLSTGSLFARHRLAVVADAEKVTRKADVEALAAYLASPARDATLVLETSELPGAVDKSIVKLIPKQAQVIFWELFEGAKKGWIVNFFRQRKVSVEPGVVDHILDMVTNNTRELRLECERLALYVGPGATLDLERVEHYLYHSKEENAYTLFDQMAARDHAGSQEVLDTILLSGENDPQQVAASLLWQFGRVVKYKRLVDREHYNPEEAFASFKPRPILGRRNQATVLAAAKSYTAAELDAIVTLLAELDTRFRMGKADLHPLMLQMAVYYITRNGGRGAWKEFAARVETGGRVT
jgi:DNA polymerase-3 subunit delta